jgi:hypothetical protein
MSELSPVEKRGAAEIMASRIAERDPLPGPLAAGFDGPIQIGNVSVRKYSAGDAILFRLLDSPIYRQGKEAALPEEARTPVDFTDEECCEIAYQFTRPGIEVYNLFTRSGRQAVRDAAMKEIAFNGFSHEVIGQIVVAVGKQIEAAWSTMQQHKSSEEKGDTKTFFPQTATAGSSNTQAGS